MSDRRNTASATCEEVEEFLYREAALLDAWQLDEWLALTTADCGYYVPPNDKPDADHRTTLFTVADDHARLIERVKRLKDPSAHAEYPPSRTRRLISNVRVTGHDGDTIEAAANFVVYRFAAATTGANTSGITASSCGVRTAPSRSPNAERSSTAKNLAPSVR